MNSNFRFRNTDIKRLHVRGTLSADGTSISYTDENDATQTVTISDIMKEFAGLDVGLTIGEKQDEDLSL